MPKTLVFTATYNEADNIRELVKDIFAELPECEMLVVDDHSPDGTGQVLEELRRGPFPRLSVIHRPGKLGLGTAHKLAVKYALAHRFDRLITMDADFSHHPRYLKTMMAQLDQHEFVTASRYAEGGRCDYGPMRILLSRTANLLTRFLLGVRLKETTTSYRGFNRSLLDRMNIDAIHADGYSYFVESIAQISILTRDMVEFPIHFEDRRAGTTKISKKEIYKGFTTLAKLGATRLLIALRILPRLAPPKPPENPLPCNVCGGMYHVEMYAATVTSHESAQYNCTSKSHASHGRIVECLECGLVSTNPQLPSAEMLSLYSQVEDRTYLEHADARALTFSRNLEAIEKFLPRGGTLLEVGAYCGLFLKLAREHGYAASGVEPSRWASGYAREKLNLPVMTGSVGDVPVPASGFDIVCAWDVLEHMSDPMGDLRRINARMKMGGVFAFSTLDFGNWLPRLMGERWPWMMDMHLYYFDVRILKEMLSRAGFRLTHSQPYCHIITLEYFMMKLHSLGIWGAGFGLFLVRHSPFAKLHVPFRFGDIQLFVCEKVEELGVRPGMGNATSTLEAPAAFGTSPARFREL